MDSGFFLEMPGFDMNTGINPKRLLYTNPETNIDSLVFELDIWDGTIIGEYLGVFENAHSDQFVSFG